MATPFLALEVVPNAAFNRQQLELLFYERYMASATTYRGLNQIEKVARTEAARCGLFAMDALHVAAAFLLKADEIITTEKPGKPMYRTRLVRTPGCTVNLRLGEARIGQAGCAGKGIGGGRRRNTAITIAKANPAVRPAQPKGTRPG